MLLHGTVPGHVQHDHNTITITGDFFNMTTALDWLTGPINFPLVHYIGTVKCMFSFLTAISLGSYFSSLATLVGLDANPLF